MGQGVAVVVRVVAARMATVEAAEAMGPQDRTPRAMVLVEAVVRATHQGGMALRESLGS